MWYDTLKSMRGCEDYKNVISFKIWHFLKEKNSNIDLDVEFEDIVDVDFYVVVDFDVDADYIVNGDTNWKIKCLTKRLV